MLPSASGASGLTTRSCVPAQSRYATSTVPGHRALSVVHGTRRRHRSRRRATQPGPDSSGVRPVSKESSHVVPRPPPRRHRHCHRGALTLLTGTALAHDCFIGTKNLNGPSSDSWHVVTVPEAAVFFGAVTEPCPAQVDAGLAAVRAEKLPLTFRIFARQTIGEKAANGTLSNGKGLENFTADSPLPAQTVGVYAAAANATAC
jgi:hypothetical protein